MTILGGLGNVTLFSPIVVVSRLEEGHVEFSKINTHGVKLQLKGFYEWKKPGVHGQRG